MNNSFKFYINDLLKFSFPIVVGQVGVMLVGVGDTFIASKHAATTLAAVGIAIAMSNPIMLFGLAAKMGISPYLSIKKVREFMLIML